MLPSWYDKYKLFIDKSIEIYFLNYFENTNNLGFDEFKEACVYACKWWKRVRAILALEFYIIFSWKKFEEIHYEDDITKYLIAIEILHAYSLVHDDLPCMDNDTIRRWELTTWKKYNETTATLVWDMLNTLSIDLVNSIWSQKLTSYFAKSAWFEWMLWWQVLDLYYERNSWQLTYEFLKLTHDKKTWALIDASIVGWIYIAEKIFADREDILKQNLDLFLNDYNDFWYNVWLAFQIKDDLLDVEWTAEETWKSVWSWEKKWFVHFLWLEKTHKELNRIMDSLFLKSELLHSEKIDFLLKYIATRKK